MTRSNGKRVERRARAARRPIDPVVLLSVGIPVLTAGVLATVNPSATEEPGRPPTAAPLTSTVVVCPAPLGGADRVTAALADPAVSGPLRTGGRDLAVRPGQVAVRRAPGSVVLRGNGPMAPGLVAARAGAGAGTDCREPQADVWFVGVGAGPEHASVLTLANPDGGPALADVTVHASDGVREVSRLRGVAVEPRGEVELDLAALMPERDDVTVHVTVSRGRLASWVDDRTQALGSDERALAWLPPAAAPATDLLLPGVARGTGERTLVLTNPGEDQSRVELAAVTPESEFTPTDLEPVQVPPGATVTVDLSRFLASGAADGVLGLRLESSAPVTGVLRTRRGGTVTHAVAATPLQTRGAVLVDAGAKRLVLAGADQPSRVRVLQRAGDGGALEELDVTVRPGRGQRLALADRARYVEVVVGQHPVTAAVELGGAPLVRPVRELATEKWVPDVGPALY